MYKPVIVVPMGDPAGIGPEITVKMLVHAEVQEAARVVVVGDRNVIQRALAVRIIGDPAEGDWSGGRTLNLIALDTIGMTPFEMGAVNGICGRAAYEYIAKSIELALARKADAVATAPVNKESLKAGGVPFIGHTEIFGRLTGAADPLTMFETRGLRIFFLSRHVSLRRACDLVTKERIVDYVKRSVSALKKPGVNTGTMAVAGLNPHSGEHGLFGDEEAGEIVPAVSELQAAGYAVAGPIGADSVFHLALKGIYNSILSLYHDQGHIAAKTLDFDRTISITGGMPILRTSVDHGTAFDIAGKNIASEISMTEAVLLAAKYSPNFTGGADPHKL
ncbi:MAG: 4-hydroxythreonine-4-phosphate dehydrogenase PdxA [Treponema sp.]|nr:4-hydroxythreonine-4-phosphate dehydrogenase PdxA [Treponema sp.]